MGTLQVGGTTLGVKNTSTNKVDLSNVGAVTLTDSAVIPASIGGTMVFLEKYTADNAVEKIFDLGTHSETFNEYEFHFKNIGFNIDDRDLYMLLGTATNNIDSGSNYVHVRNYAYSNGSSTGANQSADNDIMFRVHDVRAVAGFGISGILRLFNPRNSSMKTFSKDEIVAWNTNQYLQSYNGSGVHTTAQDDRAVKFYTQSSTQIVTGTITVYGVRDA